MSFKSRSVPSTHRHLSRVKSRRLLLEALEHRRLLTAIAVTNTLDAGPGSLRDAIIAANDDPGANQIVFNIPTSDPGFADIDQQLAGGDSAPDVFVITPLSQLPTLSDDDTFIDGGSQTSLSGDTNPMGPEIVLDGSSAGTANGLTITSASNRISGLNIRDFSLDAVSIAGVQNNWISANYLGTDATGTFAAGNGGGVSLGDGPSGGQTSNNVIGTNGDGVDDELEGNLISGNGSGVALLWTSNQVIAGNLIGTDRTGSQPLGNGFGVRLMGSEFNQIGTDGDGVSDSVERNVISGNTAWNVRADEVPNHDNVIAGNIIGLDITGSFSLGGATNGGLDLVGARNRIGTNGDGVSDAVERNVISGNGGNGIALYGPLDQANLTELMTVDNIIAGNYIGIDATGQHAIGNGTGSHLRHGIQLGYGASFTRIGTDGNGIADAAERNVISGHSGTGLVVHHDMSTGNVIAGNYLGTNADGSVPLGNAEHGIYLQGSNSLIGTNGDGVADIAEANHIVASGLDGIIVEGIGHVIAGNRVGVDASGAAMGNARGIHVFGSDHRVGTNSDGQADSAEGNVIAHSTYSGVAVRGTGVSIRGNKIFDNGGLGIDLNADGPTANDIDDADIGPNDLQNSPLVTSSEAGSATRVTGTFQGAANQTLMLDFYASPAADPGDSSEGERHLGSVIAVTDASGAASYSALLASPTTEGEVVTATATNMSGSTSEFSVAVPVLPPAITTVEIDVAPGTINVANQGVVAVYLFTTDAFDAASIDVASVRFAGASAIRSALEDVDGDGDLDRVLHFETNQTSLADIYAQLLVDDKDLDGILDSTRQVTELSLTGETLNDEFFEGFDTVDLLLGGRALRELLDTLFG